jgi:threonine synthase
VAGLIKAHDQGHLNPGERVVCTLTGHGLKDPERAISAVELGAAVEPTSEAVAEALGL